MKDKQEGKPHHAIGGKDSNKDSKWKRYGKIGRWFRCFCYMHIPIFGFFYMLIQALRKKIPEEEKTFAMAYVLYRVLVLILAITVLVVLYRIGIDLIDGILAYAN